MARIWQEGFESGIPHGNYLEGNPDSQFMKDSSFSNFPDKFSLVTGRNIYSQYAICNKASKTSPQFTKNLSTTLPELYLRTYLKITVSSTGVGNEIIGLKNTAGNYVLSINQAAIGTTYQLKVRVGSSYVSVGNLTLADSTWHKIDIYLKINSTTGAYDVKINDLSIYSDSNINTGSDNINNIAFGHNNTFATNNIFHFDDIALNDTTGSRNNSWCGDGTIIGLKPKTEGNYSQFTSSQGWALAEASTNTTTLKVTAHGLSADDVIYNVTRDAYRIVGVTDVNTLTMTAITGQVEGDTIIAFTNISTITATSGTTTSLVRISGHNLESYDVFVNTTRSNAIRRVIYVNGTDCYNSYTANTDYAGSTVASQATGDSIKTFKIKQYPISDHYKAVNTVNPNPQYSNIQSGTADQIDTFDMEELIADKGLPANTKVIAVSHNTYAKEKGAGSQFKPVIRIGSTDYEGNTISLSGGTLEYQQIHENSPATGVQWGLSEVDNLEAGVKVV
jgi:hypothetical protein